jgi:hypothetical protein
MAPHQYLGHQKKFTEVKSSDVLNLIKKSKLQKIAEKKSSIFLISSTIVVFLLITKIIIF